MPPPVYHARSVAETDVVLQEHPGSFTGLCGVGGSADAATPRSAALPLRLLSARLRGAPSRVAPSAARRGYRRELYSPLPALGVMMFASSEDTLTARPRRRTWWCLRAAPAGPRRRIFASRRRPAASLTCPTASWRACCSGSPLSSSLHRRGTRASPRPVAIKLYHVLGIFQRFLVQFIS
jgi:hypothetical protein